MNLSPRPLSGMSADELRAVVISWAAPGSLKEACHSGFRLLGARPEVESPASSIKPGHSPSYSWDHRRCGLLGVGATACYLCLGQLRYLLPRPSWTLLREIRAHSGLGAAVPLTPHCSFGRSPKALTCSIAFFHLCLKMKDRHGIPTDGEF